MKLIFFYFFLKEYEAYFKVDEHVYGVHALKISK